MTDPTPEREPTYAEGFRKMAPVLPSLVPFGMIAGVAAAEAGLDLAAGVLQSVIIFAGASQIAMTQLMGQDALPLVIIATGLVINLRFLMYSASMAPHIHDLPLPRRWLISYLLTDQCYAITITRLANQRTKPSARSRFMFFFGAATPMYLVWQASAVAGYLLGSGVPEGWQLKFGVPLSFLAIMVPAVQDRPSIVAAVVGGGIAVLAGGLPYNLGLMLAAILGITAGVVAETRLARRTEDAA